MLLIMPLLSLEMFPKGPSVKGLVVDCVVIGK